MSSQGWGCPHDVENLCDLRQKECEPGAEGCVLRERFLKSEKLVEEKGKEGGK